MTKRVYSFLLIFSVIFSLMPAVFASDDAATHVYNADTKVFYTTLTEAVANVNDGETLEILANIDEPEIIVDRTVYFFIDGNGFQYDPFAIAPGENYSRHVSGSPYDDYLAVFVFEYIGEEEPETPSEGDDDSAQTGTDTWDNPYSDVKSDSWYYDYVKFVTEEGIMNGTGGDAFSPDVTLTRAMLITMLWRLEGCPEVTIDVEFEDVVAGEWYYGAVAWAYDRGIALGYGNGFYGTNDQITREQAVMMLYRYAKSIGIDTDVALASTDFFTGATYSDWAKEAILWADRAGIFNNVDPVTHNMTEIITRAEVAAYFEHFYTLIVIGAFVF